MDECLSLEYTFKCGLTDCQKVVPESQSWATFLSFRTLVRVLWIVVREPIAKLVYIELI